VLEAVAGGLIAAAIARAPEGGVVSVPAGVHRERLVLTRRITLVGEEGAVIDGGGVGDVIAVKAPGCRLEGLTVVSSGAPTLGDDAGIRVDAPGVTIDRCRVERCLYGIYLAFADRGVIRGNVIRGLTSRRQADRGDGIRLHASHGVTVVGNDVADTRDGIYFNGSSHTDVRANVIARVRYGLHYMYADDNRFSDNRFLETEAGAAMMFSRRITLRHNVFTGNRGYRAYGLLIKDCEASEVVENVLADNRTGLFVDGAIGIRFTGNLIAGNDVGIEVRASAEDNAFAGNLIMGNTTEVTLPTGTDTNTWRGNHWGAYDGYDLDGDGKGDVPHRAGDVFGWLVENMPPARLFLLGPGVQALAFAERTLPVLDVPQVVDAAPMMTRRAPPGLPPRPTPAPARAPFLLGTAALLVAGLLPVWLAHRGFRP
jgi:nitrous oxidase accessory protein